MLCMEALQVSGALLSASMGTDGNRYAATLTVEGTPRDGPPWTCAATSSPPQTLGLPKQSTVWSTTVASSPHVTPCIAANITRACLYSS